MCYFYIAILHFRNFHNAKKRVLKMQHAMIHSCIIIIAILGIWAGFNSNLIAKPPIPKFCSLHSWLGIVTIVIFLVQVSKYKYIIFLYSFINSHNCLFSSNSLIYLIKKSTVLILY